MYVCIYVYLMHGVYMLCSISAALVKQACMCVSVSVSVSVKSCNGFWFSENEENKTECSYSE
jgi:hypothetical protein